ncbi:metal-dependent hydrolase [halophilic archaeon]|nr:metal-dependent hydrolase [halophilic archaeon]
MHRPGHYGVALALYAPLGFALVAAGESTLALAGGLATLALTNLPDLDGKTDRLRHRGPTHSLVFALAVGVLAAAAAVPFGFEAGPVAVLRLSGLGFAVGVLAVVAHLVADVINPMGVRPFWPFSDRRFTFDLVLASDRTTNYLLFAVGVTLAVVAWVLGRTTA